MLSWTFKAGKYQTGRGTLEKGCTALACFNIIGGLDDTALVEALADRLQQKNAPSAELRSFAAQGIRNTANGNHGNSMALGAIGEAMRQVSHGTLQGLLHKIADCLTL